MNGLQLAMAEQTLAAYLLAVSRVAGFVLIAPPFNSRSVPGQIKAGGAFAIAIPISAVMKSPPDLNSPAMLGQLILQVLTGVIMGFFVLAAVAVIAAVGDLVDLAGGFNISIAMDPLQLNQVAVFGRIHNLIAFTLLWVTGAHTQIILGLSRTVELMPSPSLQLGGLGELATKAVSEMFVSAIQVAAPVIAVMFLADITLGLLTRAAPALNAFQQGLPFKILLTLLLAGLLIHQIPATLEHLINGATGDMLQISGG